MLMTELTFVMSLHHEACSHIACQSHLVSPALLFCLCSQVVYISNTMDPDLTAPFGSSLIRVHIICFYLKLKSEVHLNSCSRRKKQTTFSGQKKVA